MNFFQKNGGDSNAPTTLSADETRTHMMNQERRQRILEKFQERPFTEENGWWYSLALFVMVACSLVNLVTGASAIQPYFSAIFGVALVGGMVAWLFAVGLPLLLEYGSWRNGTAFWERYLFRSRLPQGHLVAQFAIMVCVIFLSYKGAPELVKALGNDPTRASVTLQEVADVRSRYEPQIDDAKKAAKDFKDSRSWLGKLSVEDGRKYAKLTEATAQLRSEMNEAIKKVETDNSTLLAAAEDDFADKLTTKEESDRKMGEILAFISIITAIIFNVMLWLREKYEFIEFFEQGGQLTTKNKAVKQPTPQIETAFRETDGQIIEGLRFFIEQSEKNHATQMAAMQEQLKVLKKQPLPPYNPIHHDDLATKSGVWSTNGHNVGKN